MYFSIVTSGKIFFSCISVSCLSCIQRFFSKLRWGKLCMYSKQTNLENQLHISTESPKKCFNDTVFQNVVDELEYCNSDMQMDLPLLVPVFLCLCLIYLVAMLYFRIIFSGNLFCFPSFPPEFVIF